MHGILLCSLRAKECRSDQLRASSQEKQGKSAFLSMSYRTFSRSAESPCCVESTAHEWFCRKESTFVVFWTSAIDRMNEAAYQTGVRFSTNAESPSLAASVDSIVANTLDPLVRDVNTLSPIISFNNRLLI